MTSEEGLRAEHDALAERLAIRRSVDEARKAAYAAFLGLLGAGIAGKLVYDRWFSTRVTRVVSPPVLVFAVAAIALTLLALGAAWWSRSRRLVREEDAAFARFRELRRRLGMDP